MNNGNKQDQHLDKKVELKKSVFPQSQQPQTTKPKKETKK